MEWPQAQRFPLTRTSVLHNAPAQSGVFGLSSPGKWIYIGHSANIQRSLLNYLSGQMPYVLEWQPKHFSFEALPYQKRMQKHKELLLSHQPVCNRKTQAAARGR